MEKSKITNWFEGFKHRRLCKLKREPKEDDSFYFPAELSQACVGLCLVEMDNKTKIPFKSWERDGIFYILPAYWPKELEFYVYYSETALQEWFDSLAEKIKGGLFTKV